MAKKHKGLTFYQRKKKMNFSVIKEIFSYIFIMLFAAFLAAVMTYTFGMSTNVIGVSMEPTLSNGHTIYINRFAYTLTTPKVGEVIVFLPNGNQNTHYYVKRVIAVPGDKVFILDGVCYVNGSKSPYVTEKVLDGGIAEVEFTLEAGEYFCLGDNVNNSEDSRSANIGPIKSKDIIGKAWLYLDSEAETLGFIE
ncbi:MAG: signal peptidase I [Lachnospiraceae bacterium]|nr:signal peptidase I [Lachnospiraceae bacterium]